MTRPTIEQKVFTVAIQIIEVWNVEVEASTEEEAEQKAYDLRVSHIRKHGELENVETDYAQIIGENGRIA